MTLIQCILIIALLAMMVLYFRRFRNAAIDKILIMLVLLTGIVFVIFPELTNRMAHLLGVGRGADLIFYLAIIFFSYVILLLYSKIRLLEKQIADIVRKQALNDVDDFSGNKKD